MHNTIRRPLLKLGSTMFFCHLGCDFTAIKIQHLFGHYDTCHTDEHLARWHILKPILSLVCSDDPMPDHHVLQQLLLIRKARVAECKSADVKDKPDFLQLI